MRSRQIWWGAVWIALAAVLPGGQVAALPPASFAFASNASAADVIAAVNSLRSSHGLPPYSVSPILMGTAQGQADYMASIGSVTHYGPDGSRPYQRALAAGYPLAGQIPPGFMSENIVGSPGMSPAGAVSSWTGDDLHLNTMLSSDLQEIGAGVAAAGGVNYYVIDAARPNGSGSIPAYTPGASEAQFGAANEIIVPVKMSTPNAQGDVYHEVQAGQSLWQIAIAYGVHIADMQRLNNLGTSIDLQQGEKLLVKRLGTATPAPPTSTATLVPEAPTSEPTLELPTATSIVIPSATPEPHVASTASAGGAVAAITVAALVAAALVAWIGRRKPT